MFTFGPTNSTLYMKKSIFLFTALSLAAVCSTRAQSADDIINKYADAIGGKAKLASIKNIYMLDSANYGGQKLPVQIWKVIGKSMRSQYTFGGLTGYSIIRNDSGWAFSPFQGQKQAEPMTAEQVKSGQPELGYPGSTLIEHSKYGYKVTYQGKDDIEGSEVYKLEEKITDSISETYYIDPDSYLVIRVHTKATVNGKVMEFNQDFSDYKKTPEGIMFPMTQSGGMGGDLKTWVIKINTDIDPKLFSPSK